MRRLLAVCLLLAAFPCAAQARLRVTMLPGAGVTEVALAVDPADPAHLVAAANDSDAAGAFNTLTIWNSHDAGATWTQHMVVPAFGDLTISDPVLAFSGGYAVLGGLQFGFDHIGGFARISTWSVHGLTPMTDVEDRIFPGVLPAQLDDKPWLTADSSVTLHAVWARVNVDEANGMTFTSGEMLSSYQRRDGRWSRPLNLDPGRPDLIRNFAYLIDLGGGRMLAVWQRFRAAGTAVHDLRWALSTDWGRSFGAARSVGSLRVFGQDTVAAVPGHLLWCTTRDRSMRHPRTRIVCLRSRDGSSWSKPVAVPTARPGDDEALPQLAADPRGDMWLLSFRVRGSQVAAVLRRSTDGGSSFSDPLVLRSAPLGGDVFSLHSAVGDYGGLAADGSNMLVTFALPSAQPSAGSRAYLATVPITR
jgi:hypothetical protein